MIKTLFNGLSVLAALFISTPVSADTSSTVRVVTQEQTQPLVASLLPRMQPSLRIKRGEVCPPTPQVADAWPAEEVSLVGGCHTTSEQQHYYAQEKNLALLSTEAHYQERIANGYFVPLEGSYLHMMAKRPYALPSTVAFVREMAIAYNAAGCGRLVVRDALRLTTERPPNGSIHSVHPAGMAVDIRLRYIRSECANWILAYVRLKEAAGKVDGTHELEPEHLHVVVPVERRAPVLVQLVPDSISVGAP